MAPIVKQPPMGYPNVQAKAPAIVGLQYTGSGSVNVPLPPAASNQMPAQPNPSRDIRLSQLPESSSMAASRPVHEPINAYSIADYSKVPIEQLAMPWRIEERDINRSEDWARDCTVIVKGIPNGTSEVELFENMVTLNGELPWYNHEVVATTYPIDSYTNEHRQYAFLRWSTPQFAQRCARMFNGTMLNGGRLWVAQSTQGVCRVSNDYNSRMGMHKLGGIRVYHRVWDPLDAINPGLVHV